MQLNLFKKHKLLSLIIKTEYKYKWYRYKWRWYLCVYNNIGFVHLVGLVCENLLVNVYLVWNIGINCYNYNFLYRKSTKTKKIINSAFRSRFRPFQKWTKPFSRIKSKLNHKHLQLVIVVKSIGIISLSCWRFLKKYSRRWVVALN